MKLSEMMACYYPTTVMMVDDNPRFLRHLSGMLDQKFHFKLYSNPREAVRFFEGDRLLETTLNECFKGSPSETFDEESKAGLWRKFSQEIDCTPLLKLTQKSERFDEASVLIVDYAMPGINGLDLCRLLKDHPVKKILLTGEADHRLAVDAFNEGLIDRFILKQTQESLLYQKLNVAIQEMQQLYFFDASKKLLTALGIQNASAEFNQYFEELNQFFSSHQILECYLLNAKGSFLGLNEKGECKVQVAESIENLEVYRHLAEENEDQISEQFARGVCFPYLLAASQEDLAFSEWPSHLVEVKKQLGSYCLGVSEQAPFGFEPNRVENYADYLEKHLEKEALS